MLRKSGWDSGFKVEGVNGWFYKFFAVLLLQLVALSAAEGTAASGTIDTDNHASILIIDKAPEGNSDLIWAGLGDPGSDAARRAPKSEPSPLGIFGVGIYDTEPEKLKLAMQDTGDKPATAAVGKDSGQGGSLSRMEPLRLRRAQSKSKKRTRLSPWLRALLGNFRWGGVMFDQYSTTFGGNVETVSSNSYGASINASTMTFIWQPWFALLGGGLGTTAARSDSNKSSSNTSVGQTGNAVLMVFPSSRFPFTASYLRRRTNAESELSENSTGSESFKLSQRYRSRKNTQYSLVYNKIRTSTDSVISSKQNESTKTKVNERLNFNVTSSIKEHQMRLGGSLEKHYDANTFDESKAGNLVATDSFSTKNRVHISASANYNETENTSGYLSANKSESTGRLAQFFSTAGYTSKSGKTSFNGNVRLYRQRGETKTIEPTGEILEQGITNANGTVRTSFRYAMNRNIRASGFADASRDFETDDPEPRYNQNINVSYGADPLEIGKFLYTWNSSAGLSNAITTFGESTTGNTGIGHGLGWPLYSGKNSKLTSNFSQSYGLSANLRDTSKSDLPANHTVSNSASINGSNKSGRRQSNARLSVSDFRGGKAFENFGDRASQVVNFMANVIAGISVDESIQGAFNSQYSSRQSRNNPDDDSRSSSGSVSYRHNSFFGVKRLSFISTARVSERAFIPYSGENEESATFLWENRLEFSTGRLRASAFVKWEETGDVGRGAAFIKVTRSF